MRLMKFALRFWIALTSVFSFLVGWALLAHAPKPVQAKTLTAPSSAIVVTPLPTLAPLPSLEFSGTTGGSSILMPQINIQQPQPAPMFSQAPLFSSGGS